MTKGAAIGWRWRSGCGVMPACLLIASVASSACGSRENSMTRGWECVRSAQALPLAVIIIPCSRITAAGAVLLLGTSTFLSSRYNPPSTKSRWCLDKLSYGEGRLSCPVKHIDL